MMPPVEVVSAPHQPEFCAATRKFVELAGTGCPSRFNLHARSPMSRASVRLSGSSRLLVVSPSYWLMYACALLYVAFTASLTSVGSACAVGAALGTVTAS